MQEFDRPRKSPWRWVFLVVGIIIAIVAILVVLGVVVGKGPLRSLGVNVEQLQVINWRPTEIETVIELAVTLPASGLCQTSVITPQVSETSSTVLVAASVEQGKRTSCAQMATVGDRTWVAVELAEPVDGREVVRLSDNAIVKESSLG